MPVSIHAPWEGCDYVTRAGFPALQVVSIHAPWEGCDLQALFPRSFSVLFQFTHPGKGATSGLIYESEDVHVSIHAPWEGCDRATK